MTTLPDESGVIYRTTLTRRDYLCAIADLHEAIKQEQVTDHCTVCYSVDHTAEACHHNPLVMARRAVAMARAWRCFHCDMVFTTYEAAREHFGPNPETPVKCLQSAAPPQGVINPS